MIDQPTIQLPEVITVRELAAVLNKPVTELMRILLKEGILATINDNLDFETAAIIAEDLGFTASQQATTQKEELLAEMAEAKEIRRRAPVVAILGHVDHGKTSLLDYIRQTKVAAGEAGSITQTIGAYRVPIKDRFITFIDTPGHEAFSAMRAQGAKVTDIVVLVVAADDGVKPQTIESLHLAQAAEVPVVTALTKIDRAEANLEKVKGELAKIGLIDEAWGGKTVMVPVSSKTGEGVDALLEMILLTADLLNLEVPFDGRAQATIIETHRDPRAGIVASVIVEKGELKAGDPFVVGQSYGKIRYLENERGARVKMASPGMPVRVAGFVGLPLVGEHLLEVSSEKEAHALAEKRERLQGVRRVREVKRLDLDALTEEIRTSNLQDFKIVLKADNLGSLEALKTEVEKIKATRGRIIIAQSGVGNINEGDILAARDINGLVVGFNVGFTLPAKKLTEKEQTRVALYQVIYQLTDDLTELLLKSIKPEKIEHLTGEGEVLKVFRTEAEKKIVGIHLKKGRAEKGYFIRFYDREGKLIGNGEILSIKQLQSDLSEAKAPGEFGFLVKIVPKVKKGFRAELVRVEEKKAELQK